MSVLGRLRRCLVGWWLTICVLLDREAMDDLRKADEA